MMIPLIAGPTMGGTIWTTPGEMRDEQESVNTAVQGLNHDIQASRAPVTFVTSWNGFKTEWDAFYSSQGGFTGWLERFATNGPMQKTLDYRAQLEAWREKFMAYGETPSGPGLVPKPKDTAVPDTFRYIAIAAVALGAVYVVSKTGILSSLVPRTNPAPRRRRRR